MPDETLALYHYPSCGFCMMVRHAATTLGVTLELRNIHEDPRWRDDLLRVRGRTTVPVLQRVDGDGTHWLPESRDIIAYLHDNYG